MKPFEVLYIPIGVPTFHLESAENAFQASIRLIHSLHPQAIVPDQMLLSIDLLLAYINQKNPDLIILQNLTFANSAYATEVLKQFSCPVLLWTLREPVIDGGRLRLNSLTGAFSAGYAYYAMKSTPLQYMFGSPDEAVIKTKLAHVIQAALIKHELKGMNLLMIGHTPQGFGFGRALDLEMATTFGVNLLAIESRELTQIAKKMTIDDAKIENEDAHRKMVDLEKTNPTNKNDFVKLYKVYKEYIEKNNIKAIASRCWPDFFTDYGTPVCGVLGMLNDQMIAAACETDAYGALSMHVGQRLTNSPTYLGDPVSIDEVENTITFWHCGTAACSLARQDTGSLTGVHPNRKIGPTMEFGLRPSEHATIFRIGRKPNGTFRFFIATGEILDKPKQFLGTSMVVKVNHPVNPMITAMIKEGFEPHYAVLYGDVVDELTILAEMLNLEIVKY